MTFCDCVTHVDADVYHSRWVQMNQWTNCMRENCVSFNFAAHNRSRFAIEMWNWRQSAACVLVFKKMWMKTVFFFFVLFQLTQKRCRFLTAKCSRHSIGNVWLKSWTHSSWYAKLFRDSEREGLRHYRKKLSQNRERSENSNARKSFFTIKLLLSHASTLAGNNSLYNEKSWPQTKTCEQHESWIAWLRLHKLFWMCNNSWNKSRLRKHNAVWVFSRSKRKKNSPKLKNKKEFAEMRENFMPECILIKKKTMSVAKLVRLCIRPTRSALDNALFSVSIEK